MSRPVLWALVLSMIFAAMPATARSAAQPPELKCQAAKLTAIRKRDSCRVSARTNELVGKPADLEKCAASFTKAVGAADASAAKAATSCRWLENGDGTATDLNSGLQWELKGIGPVLRDAGWTMTWGNGGANGTAFTVFLADLNAGRSFDGITTSRGCLGGKCDWRLPTVEELRGILSAQYPDCPVGRACTTIPGDAVSFLVNPGAYWTSSAYDGDSSQAWTVSFNDGFVRYEPKVSSRQVRAVRGES